MNEFTIFARLGLLLIRPGMLVIGTPFLGAVYAPVHVRAGLTVLIAAILAPLVPTPEIGTALGVVAIITREVAIGLALALGMRILITAAEFAGQLTGYQTGLSYGAVVDPQSGVRNTTIAALYSSLVIVLCFITNVHHAWLRALSASYAAMPIGLGSLGPGLGTSVAKMLGMVFVLGLRLAMPVVIVLMLVEFVLGLMSRIAPSLNLMVVGAPIRVPIGLLVIALTMSALPGLLARFVPAALELALETSRAFR